MTETTAAGAPAETRGPAAPFGVGRRVSTRAWAVSGIAGFAALATVLALALAGRALPLSPLWAAVSWSALCAGTWAVLARLPAASREAETPPSAWWRALLVAASIVWGALFVGWLWRRDPWLLTASVAPWAVLACVRPPRPEHRVRTVLAFAILWAGVAGQAFLRGGGLPDAWAFPSGQYTLAVAILLLPMATGTRKAGGIMMTAAWVAGLVESAFGALSLG